jgi:hypothetical protein
MKKKPIRDNIIKLYLIYKNDQYYFLHSQYYEQIEEIIKNFQKNESDLKLKNFDSQNSINEINNENINEEKRKNTGLAMIEKLETFLDETFKIISPEKELDFFKISLHSLRENILGRKIRITFIGNINVGKSTVLNSIIGENVLPTKEIECTNRGVIIRYENCDKLKLYETKLIKRGKDLEEYYFFETDEQPICEGVNDIKSYLTIKNNDKYIDDNDAYIVICGKLKIFEFIKLDELILNSIEFIDLPGLDNKNNIFSREYYSKILKFSNCCIYIN